MFLYLLTATGCGGRETSGIVVAGSTSVQPYVEILAEDYAIMYREQVIDVQGGGSSAGIQAVESETALIGMSSRKLGETEQHLWSIEFAIDGLAIIINPENPVTNLTMDQLRGIYAGDYTNWSEFGGTDAKIHVTTREEGSGTRTAFEEMVMDGQRITPRAIVQNSNGAVRQFISGDPYSVGYISLGNVETGENPVNAMKIDNIYPSLETIRSGDYTLYRSFLLVAKEEPTGDAMQFIQYILSPNGRRVLTNEGLIPGSASDMALEN